MSFAVIAPVWGFGLLLTAVTTPFLIDQDFSLAEILAAIVFWPLSVATLVIIGIIRLASRARKAV